ncbi:septum formation initiator family protein [Pseudarthrobacter sp. NPDC058329]|uniref:FtsB family cell division protein n=1 Tax=Pseudarthrobacter sp. NPDC058329 TaxID=3346448 RepID=UPI0036DF4643
MATRRPKVPKVASSRTGTQSRQETAGDAEVIRADFGSDKAKAGPEGPVPKASTPKAGTAAGGHTAGSRKGSGASGATAPAGGVKGRSSAGNPSAAGTETAEDQQPVPAKAFSGRMLALAVVMIAITIMLAPTVKIFFDKRAEIEALNADIAAREAEGDGLRQQVSRWQDPNYVKQQARDRINMVMPGETGYWVFGSDLPAGETSSQTGAAAQDPADLPWVDSLWESITRAATD